MVTPLSTPRAAYVHVPFCAHRCGYCDFTLVAGKDHLAGRYLAALEQELRTLGQPREVETLFVGGGTPTQLAADELERLLELMREWLILTSGGEFSVEANPAGLTEEKVEALHRYGVNRVSLGVQSFSAPLLEVLERDHREADIERAIERLRGGIENISLDLIFAVPGQTLENWRETLQRAIDFGPDHISTYGLTFEKGTAFWARRERGELLSADDALERSMYELAMDLLPEHGLRQYELSNFARAGRECRHNEVYWAGLGYYGFGPGAASYVEGVRRTNHRSVTTWLKRMEAGDSAVGESEELSIEGRAREAIWLGLRRTRGIGRKRFRESFGVDLEVLAGETIRRQVDAGLIDTEGDRIRLTREGRLMADTVAVEFL
ncbi:MAG: radical SAM protein [Planctomycetota bacterium]|nr:MAG: radical SAM protein [Planctomycetota bacterium]REK29726.1 MAG: radical SAM protein [Planctomycetota bacterium]REK30453.1 MAG: radical SAM protein [Planctomycetota bacterium]